jgi:4-amino-4-deoxy-L-arabinose transferase-like glycosyltransferase
MQSVLQLLKSFVQSRWGLVSIVLALVGAIVLQWNGPQSIAVADEIAYITGGVNLVANGEFTNPFGQPELWFPPVYPLLIGCVSLGGLLDAFLVARLISSVAAIGTLILTYQLVVNVFSKRPNNPSSESESSHRAHARGYAFIAAVFLASNPTFQHYATRALSESLATCLSLAALMAWVCGTRTKKTACWVGALIGVATLTRPECVLVLPLWLGFELFRCRDRLAVRQSILAGLTTLTLVLPYVFYLHSHTGRWSISNKGPVNLAAGRSAFHQSPREFIDPESLTMGFFDYDTSLAVESQRFLFNASKLAGSLSEVYYRWWIAAVMSGLVLVGWRHLCHQKLGSRQDVDSDLRSPASNRSARNSKTTQSMIPAHQLLAWGSLSQAAYLGVVCVFDVGGPKNLHLILPIVCVLLAAAFQWTVTNRRWILIIPATLCLTICVAEGASRYPRWTLTSSNDREQLLVQAGESLANQGVSNGVVYEDGATIGYYAHQRRGRLTPNTLDTITSFIRKHETAPTYLAVSSFGAAKLDASVRELLDQADEESDWIEIVRIDNGRDTVAVFQLQSKESQHANRDHPTNRNHGI